MGDGSNRVGVCWVIGEDAGVATSGGACAVSLAAGFLFNHWYPAKRRRAKTR
jgi:hypothetical protein